MANNIAVKITADVADLQVKRAILSAEMKAASKDLNDFARTAKGGAPTDELRAGMLKAAEAAAKAKAQIKSVDDQVKSLGARSGGVKAFDNVMDRSRLAVIEAGSAKLPIFGSVLADIGPAGIAAAAGLAAFAGAAEEARKTMEWAEELERASHTLGLTTTQLQEFDFIAQSVGIPIDKMRESMAGLEKTIGLVESGLARAMQTKAFTEGLGITPEQLRGWGDLNTQVEHVVDAASRLNVEERAAIAGRLKIDPEVLQSLIDAKGDLDGLKQKAHEYGVVLSEDTIAKQAAAGREMHEASAIMQGEMRTAFVQLAPLLVQAAKALADGAKGAVDLERGVQDLLAPLARAASLFHQITGENLGKAFEDAASQVPGLQIALEALKAAREKGAEARARDDRLSMIKDALAPVQQPAQPKPKALATTTAKGPGVVAQWEAQLHQMEVASGEFFKDQTADELRFWQGKLALVTKGSKDYLDIQSKIYDLQKTLAHQAYDEQIARLNQELEADRNNWAKEKADWDEKLAFIKEKFGEESRQYQDAYREQERATRDHEAQMHKLRQDARQEALDELKNTLETTERMHADDARVREMAIDLKAKYAANPFENTDAERQKGEIEIALLREQINDLDLIHQKTSANIKADLAETSEAYGKESVEYGELMLKKSREDNEYYNKKREMINRIADKQKEVTIKIAQTWHSDIDPLVQSVGSAMQGLVLGTESWGQALAQVGETMVSNIIDALERIAEQWIVTQIMGRTAQVTTAQAGVAAASAVAGANGVASMAGAPFPIDLGAPAFGATMATAAGAFSLGGFAKGIDVVPQDIVAQIHAGERIVPKSDNQALIAAAAGGAGAGSGGDNHLHYSPTIHGGKPRSLEQMMREESHGFVRVLHGMARSGRLDPVFKAAGGRR